MSLGDFETQKKNLQEQIATAETEAEFTMDMSEVEKLNKQLEALEATKHMYEDKVATAEAPATENQIKQITELGGTEEELVKREEVQDEKVEEVKEVLGEKSEGVEKTDKQSSIEFYKKWDDERIKNKIAELAEKIQKFESKINDLDNMSPVERSQKVLSNPFGNFDATRGELIPKFKEENQKKIDSTIQEIAILEEVLEEKSEGVKISEENKKVEGVNGLEKEILQQQLRDCSLSLHLNMEAQKALEAMKDKQVASAPFTNSLGTAIVFVEETKKLQDLEKTAIGLPRDSEDQKKAWEKFREFSDLCYAKGGMEVESKGGESFVLVKGVQGTHVEGVSLQTALEIIIKDKEEKIKEIEGKLKGGE